MTNNGCDFEVIKYINTLNINYIVIQMESRFIITMTNKKVFIVKECEINFFENKMENPNFLKGILKENGLPIYINLKNIESLTKYKNECMSVRMLNGVEIIIEDEFKNYTEIYENNFAKII